MSMVMTLDSEKARLNPESVFEHPLDVVAEPGLTRGQKIATLERWRQAMKERIRATGEGMSLPPGESATEATTIEEIAKALSDLAEVPDVITPADAGDDVSPTGKGEADPKPSVGG